MDVNPAPFRGDAGIAHVSEDFFKMTFLGANVRRLEFAAMCFSAAWLHAVMRHLESFIQWVAWLCSSRLCS
jgi:hypothetical protein